MTPSSPLCERPETSDTLPSPALHPMGRGRNAFGAFQPYPRNAWYVAAGRSEVTDKPLARELLDEPVVMFRRNDGTVAAMRDACPHRGYPLSKGKVSGDSIQCPYHGITFHADGHCANVPSQPTAPVAKGMCVRVYPTVEKWHWVWIWMGNPAKADPAQIPHFECENHGHYDHQFYSPLGPFAGNFQLIHDNLCDATHTSYLHAGLLDDPDSTELALAPAEIVRVNETTIKVWRVMRDFVPNEEVARLYHLQAGERYNRVLEIWHHFPNAVTAFNRYYRYTEAFDMNLTGEPAVEHITSLGITPATANTSYHFTAVSSSFAQNDTDRAGLLYVIGQDIEAFGDIQRYFERQLLDATEVSVASDQLGVLSRKIIAELVRRESPADLAPV